MVLVCLEGPNCSGKSTFASWIKNEFQNFVSVEIISDSLLLELLGSTKNIAREYQLARKTIQNTYQLKQKNKDKNLTIIERWYLSSIVFDYFDYFRLYRSVESLLDPDLVIPDITFVLVESEPILKERLSSRLSCKEFHLKLALCEQIYRYESVAKALNLPVISTLTDESKEYVFSKINALINT
jgi:thymidylate kinase